VTALSTFVRILTERGTQAPVGGADFQRRAVEPLVELQDEGLLESLLYVMAAHAGLQGADGWIAAHGERILALERSPGKAVRGPR
jgi:hypothetical protein